MQRMRDDNVSSDGHIVSDHAMTLPIKTGSLAVIVLTTQDAVSSSLIEVLEGFCIENSYVLQCSDPGLSSCNSKTQLLSHEWVAHFIPWNLSCGQAGVIEDDRRLELLVASKINRYASHLVVSTLIKVLHVRIAMVELGNISWFVQMFLQFYRKNLAEAPSPSSM